MHTVAQMLMGDHRVEVVRHLVPNPYALTIEARDSLLDSFITNPTDAVVIEARTTGGDGMVEHLRGLGRSAILWTMDEGQDQARIPRVEWVTRALALAQELADIALDPPQMR